MTKFFFYGSLREGGKNNYRILGSDKFGTGKKLGTAKINGFDLYISNDKEWPIPTACPGKSTLVGEVWELDEQLESFMYRFESGYLHQTVITEFGPCVIFYNNIPEDCYYLRKGYYHAKNGDFVASIAQNSI